MQKKILSQSHKDSISSGVKNYFENISEEEMEARRESARLNNRRGEHSDKSKKKMSEKAFARWSNYSPEEKEERLEKLAESRSKKKFKDSRLEQKFENMLLERKIEFEKQKHIGRYIVDFFIPSDNLIIEIQGCFPHGCEKCGHIAQWQKDIVEKDKKRKSYLESKGYKVKFIWGHQLNG